MKRYNDGNLAVDIQRKRQPETRTIQKKKIVVRYGISGKEKLSFFIAIIFLVFISLLILTRYSAASKLNYQIVGLQNDMKNMQDQNNQLKLQIDSLSNPDRIRSVAQEMGLTGNDGTVKVYNKDIASN